MMDCWTEMRWVKPREMRWVYLLAEQMELQRVLMKERHWADSSDDLMARQMVDLLAWTTEMYLAD